MFGAVIIGWFYSLLKKVEKPDQLADKRLNKLENNCPLKHRIIDDNYLEIKSSFANLTKELQFFKENGLDHIEDNTTAIRERMAKLEGHNEIIISLMEDVLNKK